MPDLTIQDLTIADKSQGWKMQNLTLTGQNVFDSYNYGPIDYFESVLFFFAPFHGE